MKKQRKTLLVSLIGTVTAVFAAAFVFYSSSSSHELVDGSYALRRLDEVMANPAVVRALRLQITTVRPSVQAFDQTEFDVFVVPDAEAPDDTGERVVKFSAKASFNGTNGITHTYTLIDGHGFYTQSSTVDGKIKEVSCLPTGSMPDIEGMLQILANALPVSKVGSSSKQPFVCPENTKKLKIQSAGEDFVLCMTPEVSDGFRILGVDVNIDIHYLTEPISITRPPMKDDDVTKCDHISTAAYVDKYLYQLLTGNNTAGWFDNTFDQGPAPQSVWFRNSACGCKGKKRPCIFFHGLGNQEDLGLIDKNPSFGDIRKHAPCCSSIKFSWLNTNDFGWTNATLQSRTCQVATSVSATSTSKVVKDTILVTHSMSNLMLAGAIANNSCSLDPSTSWVSISGPMRGSMGPNFQQNICNGGANVGENVLKGITRLFGGCPVSPAIKDLVYAGSQSTSYAPKSLVEKYAIARQIHRKYASAVICGTSFVGLVSIDLPILALGGAVIPHKSRQNDGMVEFESCRGDFDAALFKSTYNTTYYRASLNHFDTQFRHGDGLFGLDKKPLKWFQCLL